MKAPQRRFIKDLRAFPDCTSCIKSNQFTADKAEIWYADGILKRVYCFAVKQGILEASSCTHGTHMSHGRFSCFSLF